MRMVRKVVMITMVVGICDNEDHGDKMYLFDLQED